MPLPPERGFGSALPAGGLDICRAFGPLASMHAALDRHGLGMPCGIVARVGNRSVAAVDDAVRRAAACFPVLASRLAWIEGRPTLLSGELPCRAGVHLPWPALRATDEGAVWRYRLIPAGDDTWLQAEWLHAIADGHSMLRFLSAIGEAVGYPARAPTSPRMEPPIRRQPFAAWLPGFLLQQRGDYLRAGAPSGDRSEVSWCTIPSIEWDRVRALALASNAGMAGLLAAATARAFAASEGQATAKVLLNIPVAAPRSEGFGFAVGSLRFPLTLARDETTGVLAACVSGEIHRRVARGWHHNLDRLLGPDPKRHARFAAIEARRSPDPNLTVSWKGCRAGPKRQGLSDVACFAAAPTLHVSGHADEAGLSLSLTSRHGVVARRLLLRSILREMGCNLPVAINDRDSLLAAAAAPMAVPVMPDDQALKA